MYSPNSIEDMPKWKLHYMINDSSKRQQARNCPVNCPGKNTAHLLQVASCPPTNKQEHKHNLKKNPAFILPFFCFVLIFQDWELGKETEDLEALILTTENHT